LELWIRESRRRYYWISAAWNDTSIHILTSKVTQLKNVRFPEKGKKLLFNLIENNWSNDRIKIYIFREIKCHFSYLRFTTLKKNPLFLSCNAFHSKYHSLYLLWSAKWLIQNKIISSSNFNQLNSILNCLNSKRSPRTLEKELFFLFTKTTQITLVITISLKILRTTHKCCLADGIMKLVYFWWVKHLPNSFIAIIRKLYFFELCHFWSKGVTYIYVKY